MTNSPFGGPVEGNWTPPVIPEDTSILTEMLYLWAYKEFWAFDTLTEEDKAIIGNFIYQWIAAIISGIIPISYLPLPQPPRPRIEPALYKGVVNTEKLRVRTGPRIALRNQSTETPWVFLNSLVDIYEEKDGTIFNWFRISPINESPMWVAQKYIKVQE